MCQNIKNGEDALMEAALEAGAEYEDVMAFGGLVE